MKRWLAWVMLASGVGADPLTFHCYPPGAKVYRRGSVEEYLGEVNRPLELPPLPEGVTFFEVVIRHPDGEHEDRLERPSPGLRDWPERGQMVLSPRSFGVRCKDWVRYPTSMTYLILGFLGLGVTGLGHRLVQSRRRQPPASRPEPVGSLEPSPLRLPVAEEAGQDPWIGLEVGPYQVVKLLGEGTSGRVYEAHGAGETPGRVAVRVVPLEEEQRLGRIVEVGRNVHHPHVLGCYGFTRVDAGLCLFQELVEGGRTMQDLEALAPMEVGQVLYWLGPVAEALDHLQGMGVSPRDLKPSKILLTPEGSPKIFLGEGEGDDPQHALGCLVYQFLSGRLPFESDLSPPPRKIYRVSDAVNEVVFRMLDEDKNGRYASCGEALRALNDQLRQK